MRRILTALLLTALMLLLSACGIKNAVQQKALEVIGVKSAASSPPGGSAVPSPGASAAPVSGGASASSGGGGESYGSAGRAIATLEGYWEGIESEWRESPEEGYVWTITIDDTATIDMMGLVSVEYSLRLSCSHVGKYMLGAYSGDMEMSYSADIDNMAMLISATGGTVDYDADGWFKNDKFLMRAKEFSQEFEDDWTGIFGELQMDEIDSSDAAGALAQQYLDSYLSSIFDGVGSGEKDFEAKNAPVAVWYGYDFRMTEGDMSGYIQMTDIAYGTTTGGGSVDASGTHMQGSARARLDTVFGSFDYSDSYAETVDSPFPYSLKIYEGGQVVFTLYSSEGSPITVKFYGTIDRVRVEDTTIVR